VRKKIKDEELMRRAQKGDRAAFDTLTERYQRYVFVFIFSKCNQDHHLAEDVTQDAFMNAWEKRKLFHIGSRFQPWITTIALNRLKDVRRSEHRRRTHCPVARISNDSEDNVLIADEYAYDPNPGPAEELITKELVTVVRRCVGQLESMYREPVKRTTLQGHRLEDTAKELGMNCGTMKSRRHIAWKKLSKMPKMQEVAG
jgi:RNA polymerase sigma-70 factor (ECF subfamily)